MNSELDIAQVADKLVNGPGAKTFMSSLLKNPLVIFCFFLLISLFLFVLLSSGVAIYAFYNQNLRAIDQNKSLTEQVIIQRELLSFNKELLFSIKEINNKVDNNSIQIENQIRLMDSIMQSIDYSKSKGSK